jgi:hypothetical protein
MFLINVQFCICVQFLSPHTCDLEVSRGPRFLEDLRPHNFRGKTTVSNQNMGPVGITFSMDVVDNTMPLVHHVACLQDPVCFSMNRISAGLSS